MGAYPRELTATEVSPGLAALVREVAERLLNGSTAEHRVLRGQLAAANIVCVTLTGAGLYAYFSHPPETESVSPPEMIGGEVPMEVPGLDAPAGSLLKVSEGKLAFVEVYTFGDRPWPDEPRGISFGEATPLPIPRDQIFSQSPPMADSQYGTGSDPLTASERMRLRPTVDAAALERWLTATAGEARRTVITHFAREVTADHLRASYVELGIADEPWTTHERMPEEPLAPEGPLHVPGHDAPPGAVAFSAISHEQPIIQLEPPEDATLRAMWDAIERTGEA